MTQTIEFKNITFGYKKDKPVFKDLSFKITKPNEEKGFVVGLMGGSGSGKSTILKLILEIENKYQGSINVSPKQPVISYVPQDPVLFEHLTPLENAAYFNRISNYKQYFRQDLFNKVAKTLQIEDVLQTAKSVNEISGGQRQRISLLRALSIAPDILLLDEPLTGLDEEVKDTFLQTIAQLIQEYKLLVIYVTHHRKEVEFISDEILYLIKDYNLPFVEEIRQLKTKDFFNCPPTIAALSAVKEIDKNILSFAVGVNNEISFADLSAPNSNVYIMGFDENVIVFTETGFEFDVIAQTGKYTLLKLRTGNIILTISNEKILNNHSKCIIFNGKIELYSSNGIFIKTTKIVNNQISNI